MIVKCYCEDCTNYDDGECGVVNDGLEALEIADDAGCLSYEPRSEE